MFMKFTTSIFLSLLLLAAYLINSYFLSNKPQTKSNDYLPPAKDAVVRKIEGDRPLKSFKDRFTFYNYGGTSENALRQSKTGETFPGIDEDSYFVREIKAKPPARAYLEYGYVSPEKLQAEGDVKGRARLRRPDGKMAHALIVDYKGQLYDGEVGFPCFLSADTMKTLGIKTPYF